MAEVEFPLKKEELGKPSNPQYSGLYVYTLSPLPSQGDPGQPAVHAEDLGGD